jgi:hypothetical protein
MSPWINDKALSHTGTNGCRFKAARADLEGGVKLIKADGITEAKMLADIAEFGAFHATAIRPRLNGMHSWASVEFEIVRP